MTKLRYQCLRSVLCLRPALPASMKREEITKETSMCGRKLIPDGRKYRKKGSEPKKVNIKNYGLFRPRVIITYDIYRCKTCNNESKKAGERYMDLNCCKGLALLRMW